MLFSKTEFLTMIEKQNNKGKRAAGEEEQHTNEKTHEAHDGGQATSGKWGQCQTKRKKTAMKGSNTVVKDLVSLFAQKR